jgi:hypothetical protein
MTEIAIVIAILICFRLAEKGVNMGIEASKTTENTWDDLLWNVAKTIVTTVNNTVKEVLGGFLSRKKGK